MHKIAKYAIVVNVILSLLFVVSNFAFAYFNKPPDKIIMWSPLQLNLYDIQALMAGGLVVGVPNFSFYFFWASVAINLYFIVKLSREARQN